MAYFQNTLGNLRRIGFMQSTYTLLSGTLLAQIIVVGTSPILARCYAPADFGYSALFFSISSLIGMISTGRYEFSLLLPEKNKDAFHLLLVCLGMTCLASLITCTFAFFPENGFWRWVPLMVLFVGSAQTLTFWFNRVGNLSVISKGKIVQALVATPLNLLLFYYYYHLLGGMILIFSQIASYFFLNAYYLLHFIKEISCLRKEFDRKNLWVQAKKYIDFPKYNLFHALFDNFQIFGLNFLFSFFYGPTVLGYYTLTHKVLKYPLSLLSTSLSQVFMEKFSSHEKLGIEKNALLQSTWKLLFLCGILPFFILVIYGQEVFASFFGEQWRQAGFFSQVLSLWYFLNFIYSPTSSLPLLVGKQKPFMYLGIAYNFAIISTFIFSYFIGLNTGAMLLFLSFNMSAFTIFLMKWSYRWCQLKEVSGASEGF